MNYVSRFICVLLLTGFAFASGFAHPANAPQADQAVQVIAVTAKKYEFNPSPIHVRLGAKVQLNITSLDKIHGFKINLYPDGAPAKGDSGLVFSSDDDCFKIEPGTPTTVQFVARTPGTYSFHCCNRCGPRYVIYFNFSQKMKRGALHSFRSVTAAGHEDPPNLDGTLETAGSRQIPQSSYLHRLRRKK